MMEYELLKKYICYSSVKELITAEDESAEYIGDEEDDNSEPDYSDYGSSWSWRH